MTLKKYIIVYFIILNLTVVIAQKSTLAPTTTSITHTSTLNGASPTSTLTPSSDSEKCLEDKSCIIANDTLGFCGGSIKLPSEYLKEGVETGVYDPNTAGPSVARCICNQPYFDSITTCIGCFANATGNQFNVTSLDDYKDKCKKLGTTFTQTMPPPPIRAIPRKVKLGLMIGIAVVIICIIGMALLRYIRKKRRIAEESAFAQRYSSQYQSGGHLGTGDSLTAKYPPPKSPSTHYPPPPSDYPPPSSMSRPSTQHYPPPPGSEYPPPKPHGESDSYFDGSF